MDLRAYLYNTTRRVIISDATALNGLAVVQDGTGTILMADPEQGVIYGLDTSKLTPGIVINNNLGAPSLPTLSLPKGSHSASTELMSVRLLTDNIRSISLKAMECIPCYTYQMRRSSIRAAKKDLVELPILDTYNNFAIDNEGSAILASRCNLIYKVKLDGTVAYSRGRKCLSSQLRFSVWETGRRNGRCISPPLGRSGGGGRCQIIVFDDSSANICMNDGGYVQLEGASCEGWLVIFYEAACDWPED